MMAAIRASELGQQVTLVEKNPILGKKLLLSGKGRCNLTNTCDLDSFLARFSGNGAFLRDAFKKFFHRELMDFFQKRGVGLRVERQERVFPQSGKSSSITAVLKKELLKNKVQILYNTQLRDIILRDKRVAGLILSGNRTLPAEALILATGGVSYGFTGSTGDGINLAHRLRHSIVPLRPGLVPLVVRQGYPKKLAGLTLKNIRLRFTDGSREIISEIGEMLFTATGISGPLVLTASSRLADWLAEGRPVRAEIDLKPALSAEQLHARMLREFKHNPRQSLRKIIKNLLPQSLGDVILEIAGIPPDKQASQVTQEERKNMVSLLKALRLDILRTLPIEEAMVTRGGVSLQDINPRTMESRLVRGLYFAGEMIDVDADTGGFNLQAAFSTGYLAGESAALIK
jgi:predicted Rossmann fold flavoprotein